MKKAFDAVELVRDIRNRMHQKTKKMSRRELIEYYHNQAAKVHSEFKNASQSAKGIK